MRFDRGSRRGSRGTTPRPLRIPARQSKALEPSCGHDFPTGESPPARAAENGRNRSARVRDPCRAPYGSRCHGFVDPFRTRFRLCFPIARAVGALILLDTCQSSAHMPLDLSALDVDFAVFSSHKMLGPTGAGALWGRRSLLEAMPPVLTGGSMIEWVTMESSTFMAPPERFEAGSQPVAQIVAWSEALRYMSALDMTRVEAHEHALTRLMLEGISSIEGITVLGPDTDVDRIGVVAFAVDGVHPHDVGQFMDSVDVAVRVGHHCAIPLHTVFQVRSSARASVAPTPTGQEIERLVDGLSKVRRFFGR